MRALPAIAAALLLAGCSSAGEWMKPGADASTVAAAYRGCRGLAETAVAPEIGIDQDILATRGNDWQRAQTGRVATSSLKESTRSRAGSIVDSCMHAKGFTRTPAK